MFAHSPLQHALRNSAVPSFSLLTIAQYEIVFPDTYVTENEATSLLSHPASRSTSSPTPISQAAQDLSKTGKQSPDGSQRDDELELTYERVVLDGRRYLCSIPVFPEDVPQNSTLSPEEAKAEEEKELVRASSRGGELLDGMKGDCVYYLSGWWSYSFCYKDYVKQFHQLPPGRGGAPIYPPIEDPAVNSFILGRFAAKDKERKREERKTLGSEQEPRDLDDEGNAKHKKVEPEVKEETGLDLPRLETKGSSKYMVQRLSGGTECDLTGRERKIEVQVSELTTISLEPKFTPYRLIWGMRQTLISNLALLNRDVLTDHLVPLQPATHGQDRDDQGG